MTDIIVVRGLKIGKATVVVSVKEKNYEPMTRSVVINVIEQFTMIPQQPLVLLPG